MTVCKRATGIYRLTGIGFLLALAFWAAGVTLPVLHVTELFVFENAVSLTGIVAGLMREGETVIGLLVLIFTLVLPPCKLLFGYGLWRFADGQGGVARRGIALLDAIGKWTMLDVLILAIIVVTLKSSWVADVRTAPGLYFFAGSAVLALAAGAGLRHAAYSKTESSIG